MKNLSDFQFYALFIFNLIYTASLVPVFKLALGSVSAEEVIFYSFLIPSVLYFLLLGFRKKTVLIKEYTKHIPLFILMAFIGLFLNRVFYLESFKYIQATEANILYYTYPLAMAILGFLLLREKLTKKDIVGLLFGFTGAFIVITKLEIISSQIDLFGGILAILGGISVAYYLIYSKKLKLDTTTFLFYTFFIGTIITGIYILLFSNFAILSAESWKLLVYLGITQAVVIFLMIELLAMRSTFKIANALFAIPFIAAGMNYFILGETVFASSLLGLIILAIGIIIQNKSKFEKQK